MKNKKIGAEEITLAPTTEIYNEAHKIALETTTDEKFPFVLDYDANEKETLLSILNEVGAIIENDSTKRSSISVVMNMTQLKLVKGLECVMRVRTPGYNHRSLIKREKKLISEDFTHINVESDITNSDDNSGNIAVMSLWSPPSSDVTEDYFEGGGPSDYLSSTKRDSAKEIDVGDSVEGCICCPGAEKYFKFKVIDQGIYTIYTTGDLDTVGHLYDSNGNLITYVDDYEPCGEVNFRIIRTLAANSTYYIKVHLRNNDTGEYTLKIVNGTSGVTTEDILVTEIGIAPPNTMLCVGDSICLSATILPVNATNPKVSWTSGDCNIADVDSNGCVTAKSTGTTYIYATANDGSGVSDCCEVIVEVAIHEEMVSALCTKEDCYVRLDTIINNTTNDTRLKKSSGSSVVLRANTADTVQLLQSSKITDNNGEDWYQILYDGMIAYVTADSFEITTISKPIFYSVKNVIVNTGDGSNLNVRNKPYITGDLLGKFADQTIVQLMNSTPQNGNWYPIYGQLNDGTYSHGWCSGEYLGNNITYAKSVYTATLKVRASHNSNSEELGTISHGDVVVLLEANCYNDGTYIWHKISYNDADAYVVAELSVDTDEPNFDTYTEFVPLVEKSDDDYENNDISTLTPVSGNRYLTQSEMENNALIIYDYLRNKIETPWSKNAICALLGNTQAESTINPGRWQNGVGPGYGLVQWDPASKWQNWAAARNYAEDSLFGQLCKILNEVEMDGVSVWDDNVHQWQKSRVTPEISFKNFTQSNQSVNELSTIFLKCYERPKDQSSSVINSRQELCTNWLNHINSLNLE